MSAVSLFAGLRPTEEAATSKARVRCVSLERVALVPRSVSLWRGGWKGDPASLPLLAITASEEVARGAIRNQCRAECAMRQGGARRCVLASCAARIWSCRLVRPDASFETMSACRHCVTCLVSKARATSTGNVGMPTLRDMFGEQGTGDVDRQCRHADIRET